MGTQRIPILHRPQRYRPTHDYYLTLLTAREPDSAVCYLKIQCTVDPVPHLADVRRSCPLPLDTLYLFDTQSDHKPRALEIQGAFQRAFYAHWVGGEWHRMMPFEAQEFERLRKCALVHAEIPAALWDRISIADYMKLGPRQKSGRIAACRAETQRRASRTLQSALQGPSEAAPSSGVHDLGFCSSTLP